MGMCNRCSLSRIKIRAKKKSETVVTRPSKDFGMGGGVDVFVVPKHFRISLYHEIPRVYFVAWYMALPERCAC